MVWLKSQFNSIGSERFKAIGVMAAILCGIAVSILFFAHTGSPFIDPSFKAFTKLAALDYKHVIVYLVCLLLAFLSVPFILLPLSLGGYWLLFRDKISVLLNKNAATIRRKLQKLGREFDVRINETIGGKKNENFSEAFELMVESKLLSGKDRGEIRADLLSQAHDEMTRGNYEEACKLYNQVLAFDRQKISRPPTTLIDFFKCKACQCLTGYGIGTVAFSSFVTASIIAIIAIPLAVGVLIFGALLVIVMLLID